MSVNKFKCIVFDMDGTLTQTNQLIFNSFNHIAQKYIGKTFSVSEILAMFGPPEDVALLKIVNNKQIDEAMKDYLNYYKSNHDDLAKIYPGIKDILEEIKKRKIKLALFTGKSKASTMVTLQKFYIEKYFDYLVTGNDVVDHKPSCEGLNKIISHFNFEAKDILMIGDAVADVKASHDAGVKIGAVVWDAYGKDDVLKMKTDYIFYNVSELHKFLFDN